MAMCNDNNRSNNNRDEKHEIQFIRFIKYYYVLSVISRGVVSLSGVGGTMDDLDSMRDFQLNYAVNNTYNSNNKQSPIEFVMSFGIRCAGPFPI